MYVCPECASQVDLTEYSAGRHTCPNCGNAVRQRHQADWTDVARVANLAEAGYLTDELLGSDIDARIYQLDEFSALSDRWQAVYLIQVPAHSASDAASRIRQYLVDETSDAESESVLFRFSTQDQSLDPLFWRPVAMVVLAGVASFLVGQRFSDGNLARRPPGNSLSSAIGEIGGPLTTEPVRGKPRFRLSFDKRRESWLLEIDRNGDGRYDSRQQFQQSGAAW
jgi:hypothetical protein